MVICTDPTSNKSRITRYCYSLQEVKEAKENVVQSCYDLMCVDVYMWVCVGGTNPQEVLSTAITRRPLWRNFPEKHGLFSKWFQCEERQDTEVWPAVCVHPLHASSKESCVVFSPPADLPKLMVNCLKWPQRKSESGEPSPLSCRHLHHSEQTRHPDSNVWLHSITQCCVGSCALPTTSQATQADT